MDTAADNVPTAKPPSNAAHCIDTENPFNYDYDGANFTQTFTQDQQEYRNRKEYILQKRAIEKLKCQRATLNELKQSDRREKLELPNYFKTHAQSGNEISGAETSEFRKIVHTDQKPRNIERVQYENQRRRERLLNLARKQIDKVDATKLDGIEEKCLPIESPLGRTYPKTLNDTLRFKENVGRLIQKHTKKLEAKNKILYDAGISNNLQILPEQFVDQMMKTECLYADLAAQSDDDDDLNVGFKNSQSCKYRLRGFHFDTNIRGKNHENRATIEQTCLNREQWLKELLQGTASKRKPKPKSDERKPMNSNAIQFETRSDANNTNEIKSTHASAMFNRRPVIHREKTKLLDILNNTTATATYNELSKYRKPAFKSSAEQQDITNIPQIINTSKLDVHPAKLDISKSECTKLFDSRHHHSHNDPTKHRTILVKYDIQLPPNAPTFPKELAEKPIDPFVKPLSSQSSVTTARTTAQRDDYEQKIKETYDDVVKSLENKVNKADSFALDKNDVANIQCEIDSIKSCVSSDVSSVCTNFTNDSGSFMMLNNKRIPMHHITKAWVPFEDVDRCRVAVEKLDTIAPRSVFYRVPHSGQCLEMVRLKQNAIKAPNRRANILKNIRKETIFAAHKIQMARDLDNNYIEDTHGKLSLIKFRPNVAIPLAHRMLRENLETIYAEEALHKKKLEEENDQRITDNIHQWRTISNKLFDDCKKSAYRDYLQCNELLNPLYESNKLLRRQLDDVRNESVILNLEILKIEDEMRERIVCQKLNYLLMNEDWRQTHDWLHRTPDNTLESLRESIANRNVTHLRQRDSDDPWAVKQYYEINFFNRTDCRAEIVFSTANALADKIEELKAKTAERMRKLNMRISELLELKVQLQIVQNEMKMKSDANNRIIGSKTIRKDILNQRLSQLQANTNILTSAPLEIAIGAELSRHMTALCNVLYHAVVPINIRNFVRPDASAVDKIILVVELLRDLLWQLDHIPQKIHDQASKRVRKHRSFIRRQSVRAYELESRIHKTIEQLAKVMQPPKKPEKRMGKLKRYYLREKVMPVVEPVIIIPKSVRLFRKGFNADTVDDDITNLFDTPFNFHHFLRVRGHLPMIDEHSSNMITQIERRDGPEESRFHYRDVVDNVLKRYKVLNRKLEQKRMDDIKKTAHLYEIK